MSVLRRIRQTAAGTRLIVRVVALVGLGLAIVSVGHVLLSAQSIKDSTDRTLQERRLIAEVTAKNLDDHLHRIADLAAVEAAKLSSADGEPAQESLAECWALKMQLGPETQLVAVVDNSGRIRLSSPYNETTLGFDISRSPAFREASGGATLIDDSQSLQIPSILLGPNPRSTVSILSPISSSKGRVVLVVVDLSQHGTADLVEHIVLGKTGYTEVVRRDGRVLVSTRPDRIGVMSDHGGNLKALISGGKSLVGRPSAEKWTCSPILPHIGAFENR